MYISLCCVRVRDILSLSLSLSLFPCPSICACVSISISCIVGRLDVACINQDTISDGLKVLPINLMACRQVLVLVGNLSHAE